MKQLIVAVSAVALALPTAAVAHDHHEGQAAAQAKEGYAAMGAAPAAAANAAKEAYLFVFNGSEAKIKSLAGAFSDEQYAWRPADGVRSVGETFQHIAMATYYLGGMMGFQPPADAPKSFEEADAYEKAHATKAEVMASLDKAFAQAHHMIDTATPAQLDQEIEFFGNKTTGRGMMLLLADHNAEHLGQLIAYARSNGVVPPWSQPQAAAGGE